METRSSVLKHRIRKLKFEGEIYYYIRKLSHVVFNFIKNTCIWYRSSFEDPSVHSGFTQWIVMEIEEFANTFSRHVFYNHNLQIVISCLQVAVEKCSSVNLIYFYLLKKKKKNKKRKRQI